MKKAIKKENLEKEFFRCASCGHDRFRATASGVEIVKFPKDDPSVFDCVTSQDHIMEYVACNKCGEELDLDSIGFYG